MTSNSMDKLQIEEAAPEKKSSKAPLIAAIVFAVIAISLAIALAVVVSNYNHQAVPVPTQSSPAKTTEDKVCKTAGCVKAASQLLESMDTTVSPCDNFFKFSCGNWLRKNVIPESQTNYGRFEELGDEMTIKLKALLEDFKSTADPKVINDMKDMYTACMDEEQIETRGLKPLQELLDRFGGWPMVTPQWNESEFGLMEMIQELAKIDYQSLVQFEVNTDDKNSTNHILTLYNVPVGLPTREFFLDTKYAEMVKAYKTYISEVAILLGATNVEREVQDVIDFETFLANISLTAIENRDVDAQYNKMTFDDLYNNISSEFDWLAYANSKFGLINYTFTRSSQLIVKSPRFYKEFIAEVETTPNRTLVNYLLWRLISGKIGYLSDDINQLRQKFIGAIYGTKSKQARWKRCVNYVTSGALKMAAGRLFVKNYFDKAAKDKALDMIGRIRIAFDELLDSSQWMNEATRKVAKEKSATIQESIGFPDWIMDDKKLSERYVGLTGKVSTKTYFENSMAANLYSLTYYMKKIREPVDRHRWDMGPAVVNAYYSSTQNQITFPAAILQPPFWQKDRPEAMNYGGIGAVIGHEITHGFDDRGRKYDKDGNLAKWWDDDVIDKFNKAKECFVKQYSKYNIAQVNMTVNGKLTQAENMADNGGIKQAYRAFQKWQSEHEEHTLPGLSYSSNQLFFISYGQLWCSLSRDKQIEVQLREDPHSPDLIRATAAYYPTSQNSPFLFLEQQQHYPTFQNSPSCSYVQKDQR